MLREKLSSGERLSGGAVLRGSSPQGELSVPSTLPHHVDSGSLSESDLFLLSHRTGSYTIIYTLTENAVTSIHSNASPQPAMCNVWRNLVPSRNFSKCARNMARTV